MSNYYSVAIIEDKNVYWMGKYSSAKHILPLFLKNNCINKTFCIYGDETHAWCEDKYEYDEVYDLIEFDNYPAIETEWVEEHCLSREEFDNMINTIGGKEVRLGDNRDFIII